VHLEIQSSYEEAFASPISQYNAGNSRGTAKQESLLTACPLPRWSNWVEHVNQPQSEAELTALRRCVQRGCPFGEQSWYDRMVQRLVLERTLCAQGHSKKRGNDS